MPVAYFRFPPPSADLRLTKAAGAASVAAGGAVSYTMVVSNTGTAPAQNVVVTDHSRPALSAGLVQRDGRRHVRRRASSTHRHVPAAGAGRIRPQ